MNKWAILALVIVAAAALFVVFNPGAFYQTNPDAYYDYTATLTQPAAGQPFTISVVANEKAGNPVQNCWDASKFARCQQYATQGYCKPQTTFNARSLRLFIDGNETFNSAAYPGTSSGFAISSSLNNVGGVCCWGAVGACSVCDDQGRNGKQGDQAFIFSSGLLPVGTSIDGRTIFTLTFPQPTLAPGNHTLDIYYFSETLMSPPYCDYIYTTTQNSQINGWQYGDQNQKTNAHQTLSFTVAGAAQTVTPVLGTQTVYQCCDGSTQSALTLCPDMCVNNTNTLFPMSVTQYQCCDGSITSNAQSCPSNCVTPPKTVTRYQCCDGSLADDTQSCPDNCVATQQPDMLASWGRNVGLVLLVIAAVIFFYKVVLRR